MSNPVDPVKEKFEEYVASPECACEVCKAAKEKGLVFEACGRCGYDYAEYASRTGSVSPGYVIFGVVDKLAQQGWKTQKPVRRKGGLVIESVPPIEMTNMTKVVFAADNTEAAVLYVDREGWMTGEKLEGGPRAIAEKVIETSRAREVASAHDVSDGFLSIYTRILG